MRCIFCKRDSDSSKSIEHIVPESLGNTTDTLPSGVVCDKCNNYFSQNVEKPFLESGAVKAMRFHQSIPSKKGRIPPIGGILEPEFPATFYRPKSGPYAGLLELEPQGIEHLLTASSGRLILPYSGEKPEGQIVSRFVAKVAIEAMAKRIMNAEGGLDYIIDEGQFDAIRRFAREGYPKQWSHSARRIYDQNRQVPGDNHEILQTVWEYDFLQTRFGEWYFVLAIFGLELTINIGGDSIEGYHQWLKENGGNSPLYTAKKIYEVDERGMIIGN